MENELPKRKNLRLKNFDYSSAGAYFVTVCIRDRARILSDITKREGTTVDRAKNRTGRGGACSSRKSNAKPNRTGRGGACSSRKSSAKPNRTGRGGACSSRIFGKIKALRRNCQGAVTADRNKVSDCER